MNFLKKILGIKPNMSPNDFVKKFLKDSLKKHVQLELYYKDIPVLQLECLTYVPIIMDWVSADKVKYKDGYIVHFYFEKKNINDNLYYINYQTSKKELKIVEYDNNKYSIISCFSFFEKDTSMMEIAKHMRKLIDTVYKFQESNPQILYNLRYLKTVKK